MAQLQARGDPPPDFRGSNRRKRGGQPGNANRLRHGGFGRAARARREEVRALIAETRNLIIRIEMVARARCALKSKYAREVLKRKQESALPLREGRNLHFANFGEG
ncbi:MAG TPA: hypothetical protein VLW75_02175 [Rhizomicrobium sp.]|nr:hypothetical protein [Rhizomicrobium sp.]